jgi:hypothetical protein
VVEFCKKNVKGEFSRKWRGGAISIFQYKESFQNSVTGGIFFKFAETLWHGITPFRK